MNKHSRKNKNIKIKQTENLAVIELEFKTPSRASLVVQWLRIHLPMQGTRVQALVWEDSTCHGATKPVGHNY